DAGHDGERMLRRTFGLLALSIILAWTGNAQSADAEFQSFLQSLWPQAQQLGVSRATFDSATHDLEPDLNLPDLVIPGRLERPQAQPEFVQLPQDYIKESAISALAGTGRKLYDQYRPVLGVIGRQ